MTTPTPDTKPTIAEAYATAVGRGMQRSVILAAGLQREKLGVMMLRLRAEYDTVRGELERAGQIAPSAAERVQDLRREEQQQAQQAKRLSALALAEADLVKRRNTAAAADDAWRRCADLAAEVASIQGRTPADIKSAREMIRLHVPTLDEARRKLEVLALHMSRKPGRNIPPEVAMKLAGRVLDVWLDEVCHKCDGTKVVGNRYQGDTERQCRACKGTGHRRDILGDSLAQTNFAAILLGELQRQVAAAAAGIRQAIRSDVDGTKSAGIDAALARSLGELRALEAQRD